MNKKDHKITIIANYLFIVSGIIALAFFAGQVQGAVERMEQDTRELKRAMIDIQVDIATHNHK